ncbi:MAG: 5-formyltetrahydrofolate cyclo-ligase [Planctomycetota bacterium]|jgi:5-formyltetrahydrofolate cyclo-ligase
MAANDDDPNGKNALRARLRTRRDALPEAARAAWSRHLAEAGAAALRERIEPATVVAAYWPLRSEADPRPLARALAAAGARLCLPVVDGEQMQFRAWDGGEADLVPAGFGAFGPAPTAALVTPSLLLVPLLGFDARGQRLGWGKGYYDRYLAQRAAAAAKPPAGRPFAVGVAFACQQVPAIPSEAHDVPLDAVLTEGGLLLAANAPDVVDRYPCGRPRPPRR